MYTISKILLVFPICPQVYSWGVGEHGKLGHGTTLSQRRPKPVMGGLYGKRVSQVSAGHNHSAAVTEDHLLFTWGEGDHGRLGLGDLRARHTPTLVGELSDVRAVSCGESHTLVLGMCVISFFFCSLITRERL